MIDYYIYGYFSYKNPKEPSICKVTGNRFDCCNRRWYYKVNFDDNGKRTYSVTIPENGMHLVTKERLKDAKKWIEDNIDIIVEKLSTDEARRTSMRFNELVKEAEI